MSDFKTELQEQFSSIAYELERIHESELYMKSLKSHRAGWNQAIDACVKILSTGDGLNSISEITALKRIYNTD